MPWVTLNHSQRMRTLVLFFGIWLPLILFGWIAEDVVDREILGFDQGILRFVRTLETPALDGWMLSVTQLAGALWMSLISLAIALGLVVQKRYAGALFFALCMLGSLALNQLTKSIFARPRPSLWDHLVYEPAFSFPSGHAMSITTCMAALTLIFWYTRLRIPLVLCSVVAVSTIGFSRLYLGVHYLSDVVAGILASIVWVVGLRQVFRKHDPDSLHAHR